MSWKLWMNLALLDTNLSPYPFNTLNQGAITSLLMTKEIVGNENTDDLFYGLLNHHSFDDALLE